MDNSEIKKDPLHFEISSRVVWQLGEELVTDEITAVMELVKNGYDADADWVKVSVYLDGKDNRIEIVDNGVGMDDTAIESGWLYISLSSKKQMRQELKRTEEKQRAPLGEKGLGRLSTQKLGYRLEMLTGKKESATGYKVSFNWKDFTENTPLSKVNVTFEEVTKPVNQKGTTLIIRDLRTKNIWDSKGFSEFVAQVSQLLYPYEDQRKFNVYFFLNGQEQDLSKIGKDLRQAAVGRYEFSFNREVLSVEGKIKLSKLQRGLKTEDREAYQKMILPDNGFDFYEFLVNQKKNRDFFLQNVEYVGKEGVFVRFKIQHELNSLGGLKHIVVDGLPEVDANKNEEDDLTKPENMKLELANPGAFIGEIDEYNLESEEFTPKIDVQTNYKKLVQKQIGVRIFRDGFGAKPFGFKGNDWLNLGSGQTSGGSFYGLRPNNVIGFVAISVYENINLVEKTDREGFVDSPYSKNFFRLMEEVVDDINDVNERIRRSWNDYKKDKAAERGNIASYRDSLQRLKKTSQIATEVESPFHALQIELNATANELSKEVNQTLKNPLFSQEANLKLASTLQRIKELPEKAKQIFKEIEKLLPLAKQLKEDATYLEPQIQNLEEQLAQFSELAGLGLTAEALTHELYNILDRISMQTEQVAKNLKASPSTDAAFFLYVENVNTSLKNIRNQINHLAPSLKYNREQKQNIRLGDFGRDLQEHYQARFDNQRIKFRMEVAEDFTISANLGKITQIFDNLILNSEYWLKERHKTEPNFQAVITMQIADPAVRLFDNGYGVSREVESQIFQPFITTKPRNVGRGLGLFITQQLVESLGCEVYLLQQRNTNDNRYIFQLNFEPIKT